MTVEDIGYPKVVQGQGAAQVEHPLHTVHDKGREIRDKSSLFFSLNPKVYSGSGITAINDMSPGSNGENPAKDHGSLGTASQGWTPIAEFLKGTTASPDTGFGLIWPECVSALRFASNTFLSGMLADVIGDQLAEGFTVPGSRRAHRQCVL